MALSFFSYSDTVDNPTADMSSFLHEQHSEVADALLGFCEPFFDGLDPPMLFDPLDDVFCSDANATLLPSFSDSSIVSLLPELHAPCDEFGLCQCPKRPRSCSDLYHPSDFMFEADTFYAPATGPALANYSVPEFLTEFGVPPPPVAGLARNDDSKRSNNGCLSTQSMAARERRKRISNKTQELGRLIPGGSKMNTAEMLQAAYKYVKFLQAQVGILGLMNSLEGCKVSAERDEQLQVLLTSPKIHEKLCVEGKCMVPEEMAETLLEDHQIKLNQVVFKDLSCFIDSVQRLEGDDNVKESA